MESLSAYQSTFKPECILTGKKTNNARAKDCSRAERRSEAKRRNEAKAEWRKACFLRKQKCAHKT